MKITGQNVPPQHVLQYRLVVSTNNAGASAGKIARTRTGSRKNQSAKKKKTTYNDLVEPCSIAAQRLGLVQGTPAFKKFVQDEVKRVKNGEWNNEYWFSCAIHAKKYLTNQPTSTENTNPPPYAYRDPTNKPSTPEWGQGTEDAGPARYSGSTNAGLYTDNSLTWERTTHKLQRPIGPDRREPTIWTYSGNVEVDSDKRGSRPMLSVIYKGTFTDENGPATTSTDNPAAGAPAVPPPDYRGTNSLYWRYRIPNTPPPYYTAARYRGIVRNLNNLCTYESAEAAGYAVLMTAPRPMRGLGYNNCESVNTTLTGSATVYQLQPCLGLKYENERGYYFAGAYPFAYSAFLQQIPWRSWYQWYAGDAQRQLAKRAAIWPEVQLWGTPALNYGWILLRLWSPGDDPLPEDFIYITTLQRSRGFILDADNEWLWWDGFKKPTFEHDETGVWQIPNFPICAIFAPTPDCIDPDNMGPTGEHHGWY